MQTLRPGFVLPLVVLLGAGATWAQETGPGLGLALAPSADHGELLPQSLSGRVGAEAMVVRAYGGYDSAAKEGVFETTAEVRLYGPLAIRGGVVKTSDSDELKPEVGMRVQFLNQAAHGVDASFGVFYKPEGFDEPDGEIEAVLAASHSFGDVTALVNLAAGKDMDKDDADAEVRIALLYRLNRAAQIGFDSRLRFSLTDDDDTSPSSEEVEPTLDFVAGPIGSYVIGPIALLGQVGVSVVKVGDTRSGVIAVAGLATTF
jgi:hypothetical protein